jgi:hypothetical protein
MPASTLGHQANHHQACSGSREHLDDTHTYQQVTCFSAFCAPPGSNPEQNELDLACTTFVMPSL